jgi:hypothetical protein
LYQQVDIGYIEEGVVIKTTYMQGNGRRFIHTLLVSVILFIAGMYSYGSVKKILLPDADGGSHHVTELNGSFIGSLNFSLILALIPACIVITSAICRARNYQERFTVASLIIVITLLTVFVRQQILHFHLQSTSEGFYADAADFGVRHLLNETDFEMYMLAGLLGGCIITCIIYTRKK